MNLLIITVKIKFYCNFSQYPLSLFLNIDEINRENVNIISKNIESSSEGGTWKSHFTTVGKINSDTNYTEKTITTLTSWEKDANTYNYQKATFNQYADRLKVSGSQGGKCGQCGEGAQAYINHVYSEYQLLNGTDADLHKLAMGDGSLKSTFSQGSSQPESWVGDTTKPLTPWTSGEYYSSVNAGTVPTESPTAEAQAIAFAADESWNCSGTSEVTVTVDQTALNAVCDQYGLAPDGGDNWIDCWGIIGY